jgi:hypothetical protein
MRLLVSDTQALNHVFEDSELLAFQTVVALPFQSGQRYDYPFGNTLPVSPVTYLRAAALALKSLAANKSRLASIKQLLDVKLDSSDAAIQLRATADSYLQMDEDNGAFCIIEQVSNSFSFSERFWNTVQRQQVGV